jgi:hypothetical protein
VRRDADWERIAALYADDSLTLKQIARLSGVPVTTIASRARRRGWPERHGRRKTRQTQATFRTLLKRIFRALDRQMREIEQRLDMAEQTGRRGADMEHDARALASLTRTLEKLRALQREAAAEAARGQGDGADAGADAHRMELERRLSGLLAATGEVGVPEQPE